MMREENAKLKSELKESRRQIETIRSHSEGLAQQNGTLQRKIEQHNGGESSTELQFLRSRVQELVKKLVEAERNLQQQKKNFITSRERRDFSSTSSSSSCTSSSGSGGRSSKRSKKEQSSKDKSTTSGTLQKNKSSTGKKRVTSTKRKRTTKGNGLAAHVKGGTSRRR